MLEEPPRLHRNAETLPCSLVKHVEAVDELVLADASPHFHSLTICPPDARLAPLVEATADFRGIGRERELVAIADALTKSGSGDVGPDLDGDWRNLRARRRGKVLGRQSAIGQRRAVVGEWKSYPAASPATRDDDGKTRVDRAGICPPHDCPRLTAVDFGEKLRPARVVKRPSLRMMLDEREPFRV
jgi:hypothetical protein